MQPRHPDYRDAVASIFAQPTAGAAAMTLLDAGVVPVTVEFKIHLLRAARGTQLACRADVLKSGARLTIVEAAVFALDGGSRALVAKLIATMAPVAARHERRAQEPTAAPFDGGAT